MRGLVISNKHTPFRSVFETLASMGGIHIRFHLNEEEPQSVQREDEQHLSPLHSPLHSSTIGRYLARVAKLYPENNLNDATLSDEYVEIISDLLKMNEIETTQLEELFSYLEPILTPETDGFLVGGSMSWADIYLWKLLERIESRFDLNRYDNVSTFKQILFKRVLNHEK